MSTLIVRDILKQLDTPFVAWRVPVLIGVFGLPGTGKTEITRWLAARYPLIALSTDAIRLRYQLPSGPATLDVMYEVAAELWPRNAGIIFDGIHMRRDDRARLQAFAEQHHAHSGLIYTTAEPKIIEERLVARQNNMKQTVAEGKFVITPSHFARIASWLDVPEAEEAVWQIDTSAGRFTDQLTRFTSWLDMYAERPTSE